MKEPQKRNPFIIYPSDLTN